MHNITVTARDSPVEGGFREGGACVCFPKNPWPGRRPGTAAYTVLYSTQRMGIDRRSPQFPAQREDIRVFFSKPPPHAHCNLKLPGLSQSYYLSRPIPPSINKSWISGHLLASWMDGRRPPGECHRNPGRSSRLLIFQKNSLWDLP